MNLGRFFRHCFSTPWASSRAFPSELLTEIMTEIKRSEEKHRGEIQFIVEHALHPIAALRGMSARDRALELFSLHQIWDTEENTGILIYVLLADRDIEILADRGISRMVPPAKWEAICRMMEQRFALNDFREGTIKGIHEITAHLSEHFPASGNNRNELPNELKIS